MTRKHRNREGMEAFKRRVSTAIATRYKLVVDKDFCVTVGAWQRLYDKRTTAQVAADLIVAATEPK
jgi:hypothetical protein